jgi:hypothetical protein
MPPVAAKIVSFIEGFLSHVSLALACVHHFDDRGGGNVTHEAAGTGPRQADDARLAPRREDAFDGGADPVAGDVAGDAGHQQRVVVSVLMAN